MPQAKLPDLNNYWMKYHDYGWQSLNSRHYEGAIAAIYNINALLPEQYRVEISNEKYRELTQSRLIVVCGDCKAETNRDDIKTFEKLLTLHEQIMVQTQTVKVWHCPGCKRLQIFSDTKMISNKHQNPFYCKVIPEPPRRGMGCSGRLGRHNNMMKWFYGALEELDHQLGLYRSEYEPESERDDVVEGEEDAYY